MKRREHRGRVNYWRSMADALSGLLMIVLLVMLILLLNQFEEFRYNGETPYEYVASAREGRGGEGDYDKLTDHRFEGTSDYPYHGDGLGGGGSGGGGGADASGTNEYRPEATEHKEEYDPYAAVYAYLLDGHSGHRIPQAGVRFELRNEKNETETLYTFYPAQTAYTYYETEESGGFYLPQRIPFGDWTLRQLTDIKGYDPSDMLEFEIDEEHYWDDPVELTVTVYPSRNTISVHLIDLDTRSGLSGAVFDIVAADNIVTMDGSLQHRAGEVVGSIRTDENGTASQADLYLGSYLLRQIQIPNYYTDVDQSDCRVELAERGSAEDHGTLELSCQKTAATITLLDEGTSRGIEGAVYRVWTERQQNPRAGVTDYYGRLVLTDLQKNTTYYYHQEKLPAGYARDQQTYSFHVDSRGRIEDEATAAYSYKSRIVRVEIAVRDLVYQSMVSGVPMELRDAENAVVDRWTSDEFVHMISGIQPGNYLLSMENGRGHIITVEDAQTVQSFVYHRLTTIDLVTFAVALAAAVLTLVAVLVRRKKKKNAKKEEV